MLARLIGIAVVTSLCAGAAVAQNAPPTRIRGTIAALEGQTLSVNTREGTKVDIQLNDPLTVATVKRFDLADVKPGSYVGIATRSGAEGQQDALEVLVFPEAMRGAGEGHYGWDLQPGSMMTNGTVSGTVDAKSGRQLSVSYKDGNQTIVVPPNTPVVTFAPAERSDLKPGAKVMFGATKNPEGKLAASWITVETNGVAPPM